MNYDYSYEYQQEMEEQCYLDYVEESMMASENFEQENFDNYYSDEIPNEYEDQSDQIAYDFFEEEMLNAQEIYEGEYDYHQLTEEELYDYYADQPTLIFNSGHYKIKGNVYMSIWYYKRNYNILRENSNQANYKEAKSISKKGLANRTIKVKTNSTKYKFVSGYLKTNLDKFYL